MFIENEAKVTSRVGCVKSTGAKTNMNILPEYHQQPLSLHVWMEMMSVTIPQYWSNLFVLDS